ncbi:MAG TPA: AI-2E family transporter [Sphingomicrobium sp.]|nr:AI-2E family transporter [Sphingomicrobium sp.]
MTERKGGSTDSQFVRRALIVIAIAAAAFLLWHLRIVLVLLFGAVVVGTILRTVAEPFRRWLRFPDSLAVLASVVVLATFILGAGWLVGAQIAAQAQTLSDTLPTAIDTLDRWLGTYGFENPVQSWVNDLHTSGGAIVTHVGTWLSSFGIGVANFFLVLFGGIFLAAQPRFYRTGAIKLIPPARRSLIAEAMDDSENALRLWLKGQLFSMIIIGVLTGAGLWLLGINSWLVLALLAAILEFVPFAGPILAAIPGILVAVVISPELALWTTLMYIAVQQVESYIVQPLVQQYAVHIPPVVLLFSLLAFALLFGIIGVLFAAPLAVVSYVLVKRLYVVEALDTPTPIPGEKSGQTSSNV